MRIEFQKSGFFCPKAHYECGGVRETIRLQSDGTFYWNFNGQSYRTYPGSNPEIFCDEKKVAFRSWMFSPIEWIITNYRGRKWKIFETYQRWGCQVTWKTTEGKCIMNFFHTGCCRGTAIMRSDWSDNVGLLVGMVIPLILSSG